MNNLGLNQTQPGAKRVRRDPVRAPVREGDLWSTVTVVCEHGTSPALTCNNCGHAFCGGATHIAAHIREKCTAVSDEFLKLKQKEMEKEAEKQAKKAKHQAGGGAGRWSRRWMRRRRRHLRSRSPS